MEWKTCRDTVHNHLLHDKSSRSRTPPPQDHMTLTWIQTDLFSQSDWFQTTFSSRTVPYLTQTPIFALAEFISLLLRVIDRMKGVSLCSVECRASSVHWEELSRFTVKSCTRLKITFGMSWDSCIHCVPRPQNQHCTRSLINTDAQCTCRSVCVSERQTAPLGRIWRLEVRHCTVPVRLILLTKLLLWLYLLIFAVYIVWNVFIISLNFD